MTTHTGTTLGCGAAIHGSRVAYDTYHCRCADARAASTRARKARKARQHRGGHGLIPALGTARRLRALSANGWSMEAIAAELGWEWQRVADLRRSPRPYVNITTHTAVSVVYNRLADHRGPSTRAAIYAARRGWLLPLWWDDDTIDDPNHDPRAQVLRDVTVDPVVVERLAAGVPPLHVTRAERIEAARLLESRGWTQSLIGQRLGMSGARVAQVLDTADQKATAS